MERGETVKVGWLYWPLGQVIPDNQQRKNVIVLRAKATRILPPEDIERFPNGWRIVIKCPWCKREHIHGWRAPGGEIHQQRKAHCSGGYDKHDRRILPQSLQAEVWIDPGDLEAAYEPAH